MGFIKAALNAVGGTLADQYKEIFYCDALTDEVLLRKGQRRNSARNTNNATDNVITDGSVVIVNEGQCLVVVDNGKVIDFCAEAGKYIYQTGTSPSLLTGGFKGLAESFKTVWERTQSGGQSAVDQRVYYVNMLEIKDNKYGVGNVSYRDKEFNTTITIKCFGVYSYKLQNPFIFYKQIAGNVSYEFKKSELDEQLKAEIQDALQPALRKIALSGYSYDELPLYTTEIGTELNNILTEKWLEKRGIAISSFAISSVQPDEESRKMLQKIQISRAYGSDAAAGAGRMLDAQASAFENAASNSAGAVHGFMGFGAMQNMAGGNTVSDLYTLAQQQGKQQPVGMPQSATSVPQPTTGWTCSCGKIGNEGKFCDECGAKKPEEVSGWKCSCGAISKGKFCHECGAKKPVDEPLYVCDKCGWEPTDPKNPPKFCPECGDKFDESDITNK
jgi:membrane protease subunit (stomatin/prohibitin family)